MTTQTRASAVLEIDVNNHAGVMAHVVGLFSRRAYNLEGIACLPVGDGRHSRIWLKVTEDERMPQVLRQVEKLEDVQGVRLHGGDHPVFTGLAAHFRQDG